MIKLDSNGELNKGIDTLKNAFAANGHTQTASMFLISIRDASSKLLFERTYNDGESFAIALCELVRDYPKDTIRVVVSRSVQRQVALIVTCA